MSLRINGPHHKILTKGSTRREENLAPSANVLSRREQGYALVALLAVMTVIAIFAAAAAPSIRQQAQREREREAIFRGEQLAEAIRVYHSYQTRLGRPPGEAALPTSMDQLLEGVPSGTKKIQVVRPSAAVDPLSDSGEWRLIRPGGSEMSDFVREVMLYSDNIRPTTTDQQLKLQEQFMAPISFSGATGLSGSAAVRDDNYSGPFIGVASRSNSNSVIYYYGIARHDGWIFTPIFR
jgi:type II secretory pathway pseudopilin PulG